MCFNIQIPDDAAEAFRDACGQDVDRFALESMVMESYRRGRMSTGYAAKLLGMGVIECLDWMASKGVHQPAQTMEEIERDVATVKAVRDARDAGKPPRNVP